MNASHRLVLLLGLSLSALACEGADRNADDTAAPASENEVVSGSGKATDPARTPKLGIEVHQSGRVTATQSHRKENGRDAVEVRVNPGGLQLRFPRQKEGVAVQIAAWTDASIFDIEEGAPVKTHRSFGEAKGIADGLGGTGTLYLDARANNYLPAERLMAHSNALDEITFFQTMQNGAALPLANRGGDLFLVVFADKNQNGRFDAGESEYIVLRFPRG